MRGSAPATRTSKNVAAIEAIVAPRRESVAPDMFSSLRIASKIQESGRARTAAGSHGLRQDLGPLPARQRFVVALVVDPGAHSDRRDDRGGLFFELSRERAERCRVLRAPDHRPLEACFSFWISSFFIRSMAFMTLFDF